MRSPAFFLSFVALSGVLATGCAEKPKEDGIQESFLPPVTGNTGMNPPATNGGTTTTNGTSGGSNSGSSTGGDMNTGNTGSEEDAGMEDAGPQCLVPLNEKRSFHCDYVNSIATQLAKGTTVYACRDFPEGMTAAQVKATCEDVLYPNPALADSIKVSAGPCSLKDPNGKDAVGFCSIKGASRDFAYTSDCDKANMSGGSGAWACDRVVPDHIGWTCIADQKDPAKNFGGDSCTGNPDNNTTNPDNNTTKPTDCAIPSGGDGKVYHCNYINSFASDEAKHDVKGCKEYAGSWTEASAKADCAALLQGRNPTFGTGACDSTGNVGFCENARKDREYGWETTCDDNVTGTGAWACKNFGVGGQGPSCAKWTCGGPIEPDRRCTIANAKEGQPSCVTFPFNTKEADAKTQCTALGGTAETGKCAIENVAGYCATDDNVTVYQKGYCGPLKDACKDGTFTCVKGELQPIFSCRYTGCVSPGFPSCNKGPVCVDYPGVTGFTETAAKAACENKGSGDTAKSGTITFSSDPAKACVREKLAADATKPAYTKRCKDTDNSLRYGVTSCSMSSIGDFFGAPAPESGPFTDYNVACPKAPTYAGILSCRYTASPVSGVTINTCVDFATKDGWTAAAVKTHCEAQTGVDKSTVVVSDNNSCLKAIGGTGSATRCDTTKTANKPWYPYGVPQNVCTDTGNNGLSGVFKQGPFCSDY